MVRKTDDTRVKSTVPQRSVPRFDVFSRSKQGIPVSKSEMFGHLRSLGGDFPPSLETKLAMGESLYRKIDEDGAEVVFRETDLPLNTGDLEATIRGKSVINQRILAIVPHENHVYFVYVDPSRGINLSQRIGGIHSDHFDWAGVDRKLC